MSRKSLRRKVRQRAKALTAKAVANSNPPLTTIGPGLTANQPGTLVAASYSQQFSYSGPIPPPGMLEQYDALDQGRAAKILQLAEDQSRHRMALESAVVHSDLKRSWAGLFIGAVVALSFLGTGGFLVYTGHDTAGGTIATATVASIVGAFVYGKHSQEKERTEKAKIMAGKKK